ncbi:response regulator [Chitinimonas lacunae]|uniref:histidine kinase n=1 Tax=Chitinimonas lacunae TaxID=1963018 RepID=A0ABV8MJS1_9NEIS
MNVANTDSTLQAGVFRRLLVRNIALPLAASAVSAAVFVGLIFYLISAMNWVDHANRVIGEAYYISKLLGDGESGMRGFVLTGNDTFLDTYNSSISYLPPSIQQLRNLVADNPEQLKRLQRINELQTQWFVLANEVIEQKRSGRDPTSIVRSVRPKALTDSIRREFDEFIQAETALRTERNSSVNSTVQVMIGVILLLMLLFGGSIALSGRRQLFQLAAVYDDLLGVQQKQNEALQRQDWFKSGFNELNISILGQPSINQLSDSALRFLANYLNAAVGTIYVLQSEMFLRRVASYALAPSDTTPTEFRFGESLIGQTAVSGRMLRLEEVPPGYTTISSGLGSAPPRYLLLVPARIDDGVIGVVELGFFEPPSADMAEFLQQAADQLATALKAAQYRQQLREALEQSQQLNEELQAQQEELRAANEELEEQSRTLRETQSRLETQQSELEQNNAQLDEQAQKLQQQRDWLRERNLALDQARSELQQKALDLQRASQYKSEFLANMSHELRTPLNSTLIFAKLLADNPQGNLTEEQVRFATLTTSSGNDLLNLINDILDLSKVEAGMLDIQPEPTDFGPMLESAAEPFQALAREKGLDFEVTLEPDLPLQIETDPRRVRQVLKNLLSNAFKFTREGKVELYAYCRDASHVAIEVRDSGIGIAAEHQEMVFEAFRQVDGASNREFGGTGLGLPISRNLAQLLGGNIELKSELGQGSVFTLVLPHQSPKPDVKKQENTLQETEQVIEKRENIKSHAPAKPTTKRRATSRPQADFSDDREQFPTSNRSLLVIEDDRNFGEILYGLAHKRGFTCLVALTAAEGIELACQYTPDAILLDMKLPDQSGLAVLGELKEDPRTRHIPIHVISGVDRSESALQMGAVGYLLKPADQAALQAAFERLENKLAQEIKHVLVVEDDPVQRESIRALISGTGVAITDVALASEALERLGEQVFDCMVVDLSLPDMQGLELLQRMVANGLSSLPPVIIYTGRQLSAEEEEALHRYSRSIIIKGARSPERLLDEVTLFLHQVETELPPERQRMLQAARNRDKALEGATVLLVDDDVRNIFALTSALEMKGARVEIARNGQQALERLNQNPGIDLVLMDIMMPVMDGYEAITEIRKQPQFARLPVIAVTAKAMKDDQERCLAVGANDYLAKPIDVDNLISLVRVWISTPGRQFDEL